MGKETKWERFVPARNLAKNKRPKGKKLVTTAYKHREKKRTSKKNRKIFSTPHALPAAQKLTVERKKEF